MAVSIREKMVSDFGDDELLFADGFDSCIIGVWYADEPRVVYDKDKMLEILCEEMSYEDAIDHFGFNIECAYVGERTPIYIEKFHYK